MNEPAPNLFERAARSPDGIQIFHGQSGKISNDDNVSYALSFYAREFPAQHEWLAIQHGLMGVPEQKTLRTGTRTYALPVLRRVECYLTAEGPGRFWVASITLDPTRFGLKYPAVILTPKGCRVEGSAS